MTYRSTVMEGFLHEVCLLHQKGDDGLATFKFETKSPTWLRTDIEEANTPKTAHTWNLGNLPLDG